MCIYAGSHEYNVFPLFIPKL